MRIEYEEDLKASMDQYDRDVQRALTGNALRNYRQADAEAFDSIDVARDWMVIDTAALAYITEYSRLLVDEGVTIINGAKIPWMKDWSTEARVRVAGIIEEGIAEGIAPGKKELVRGGFPEKTTAAKLREFFADRKSHASTVARTETAIIRATAKSKRWKERGYDILRITDGRAPGVFACNCEQYDGQFWTREYYDSHQIEHPNCGRNASPVLAEDVPEGTFIYGLGNVTIPREVPA